MKVAVLGASGMLGAMVLDTLASDPELELVATTRSGRLPEPFRERLSGVDCRRLDAEQVASDELAAVLAGTDWIVNAIGIIKPYIHDDNAPEVERATRVNALFPHLLARAAERIGARVLQIATDCVYSGTRGRYVESDPHDPTDVYGKTKSLGEVHSPAMTHLRCSIVGPELAGHRSLLDWLIRQPADAAVNGFLNHLWNGVTTLQFARLCRGIVRGNLDLPRLRHVVPADVVTKATLLEIVARAHHRADLSISPVDASVAVDRTLDTEDRPGNELLWRAAGYEEVPTVRAMVEELADRHPVWPPAGLERRTGASS